MPSGLRNTCQGSGDVIEHQGFSASVEKRLSMSSFFKSFAHRRLSADEPLLPSEAMPSRRTSFSHKEVVRNTTVKAPLAIGDVVIKHSRTGINIVACKSVEKIINEQRFTFCRINPRPLAARFGTVVSLQGEGKTGVRHDTVI